MVDVHVTCTVHQRLQAETIRQEGIVLRAKFNDLANRFNDVSEVCNHQSILTSSVASIPARLAVPAGQGPPSYCSRNRRVGSLQAMGVF